MVAIRDSTVLKHALAERLLATGLDLEEVL